MADALSQPRTDEMQPVNAALTERTPPSLMRTGKVEDLAVAVDLGFSHVLLTGPELSDTALELGLAPVVEVETPTSAELARLHERGVAGFYFRQAHTLAPARWTFLLEALREGHHEILLLAELFGASPAQSAALAGVGFNFATCSSCYWDLSASWLNGDTERTELVAPAIAFAAAPGTRDWDEQAARRALRLSSIFAPAWVVQREILFSSGAYLQEEVRTLLTLRRSTAALHASSAARVVSSPGSAFAVLKREGFIAIANSSMAQSAAMSAGVLLPSLELSGLRSELGNELFADGEIALAPAEIAFFLPLIQPDIMLSAPKLDISAPRIAIEQILPQVDGGRFPVRRVLGELVSVEADILTDGHEKLGAELLYRHGMEKRWHTAKMRPLGNDRWQAAMPLKRLGRHGFVISAWKDRYASFVDELNKKHAAGVNMSLELQEGLALVEEASLGQARLRQLLLHLRGLEEDALRETLLGDEMQAIMQASLPRQFLIKSHEVALDAEPRGAAFASWYEIFPRSQAEDSKRHGNFRDVIKQLPRIAGMGFDVLYFPPIHPIGKTHRKGRNNALHAEADDPGSPYAIGSSEGGHDALHPQLGTLEDFGTLVKAAKEHGLEIALDFAIQCSPDHPWLKEHRGWFNWRPDGSIKYAENPPKKYEDIVNVDFYTEDAKPDLWLALRDVVQFWVDQGIRYFRVDNPHTKPFPFWEWMIADIRSRHPDAIFLAEAFTRPKIMYRLAKIGFSQSYTYFTWRNTKQEFTEYLTELTTEAPRNFFRPHFFVNTPDINPAFLQTSGRGGFLIRAVLAATLSGLFGVYNGFELCESASIPGKEEYLNSEKYELKTWDYERPGNIVAEITALNRVRRENAALQSHLGIEFLNCDNDQVLYFRKFASDGNQLLIAIGLDPNKIQYTTIELPMWRFGLPDSGALAAQDLIRGNEFTWFGKYQPVRLDPQELPYCIWRVGPA